MPCSREVEQTAKPADSSGDTRTFGTCDVRLDSIDSRLTRLDVNTGIFVARRTHVTSLSVEQVLAGLHLPAAAQRTSDAALADLLFARFEDVL